MFGQLKFPHPFRGHGGHLDVSTICEAAAAGLAVPLTSALVGGLIGGFGSALIGFGLGFAVCAASILILTAMTTS